MPVADVLRLMGITEQTVYRWKRQYAGMQSEQVREYKQLVDENTRLKELVAKGRLCLAPAYLCQERPAYKPLATCIRSSTSG